MAGARNDNRLEALKCAIACVQGGEGLESILNRAEAFFLFIEGASAKPSRGRVARNSGSGETTEAVTGGRKRQAGSD